MITQLCLVAPSALASTILGRLARSGLGVPAFPAETPAALPAAPTPDSTLLLINPQGMQAYKAWSAQAELQGWRIVDITANVHNPFGQVYGWMIAAGGEHADLALAVPVIEALAPPLPKAWLHAGGRGAGAFLQAAGSGWLMQSEEVWQWLQRALQQPGSTTFDLQSWQHVFQSGFERLQNEAKDYLALDRSPFKPWFVDQTALLMNAANADAPARQLAKWLLALPAQTTQSPAP